MNQAVADANDRSDQELLDALQHGHEPLGVLYDRYSGLVYGLSMRILQDPDEAADLTQEVFLALSSKHSYDAERGALAAYLASMTRSRAIDRLRARTRHLRLLKQWNESDEPAPRPDTPHHVAAIEQMRQRVRDAMADLSEREREVLELAYYSDLSQTEIAERLDAPLGSVKSWARRGLQHLQQSLGDLG